jgi:MoxR-like ATPase
MSKEYYPSFNWRPDIGSTNLPVDFPPTPSSIEETGLQQDLLIQLLVKTLYVAGELTEASAAQRLKIPYGMVEELFRVLRTEKLCEVKGLSGARGILYRYTLTDLGRSRARDYLDVSQYVGPAPVPLAQYDSMMHRQSVLNLRINRHLLEQGVTHLVLPPDIIEQLGEAVNSGWPIFLYGEPGNGKTVMAEAIGDMLGSVGGGEIFVPYAIEVDNQIIQVYDPVTHQSVDVGSNNRASSLIELESELEYDARWVLCKRPIVFVGGELTLQMLDLSFNPISKYYEAPPQVKASGGVFIIDDFGRQQVRPQDLLNRWIVPLEKRVDYLTLHTGKKFRVPFDTIVVFATNIEPYKLADEAFLRRIRNKIYVDDPTLENYMEIFKRYCEKKEIPFDPDAIDYLYQEYYLKYRLNLRSCHPRDLIEQIVSIAKFNEIPPSLDRELLDRACRIYFLLKEPEPEPEFAGSF